MSVNKYIHIYRMRHCRRPPFFVQLGNFLDQGRLVQREGSILRKVYWGSYPGACVKNKNKKQIQNMQPIQLNRCFRFYNAADTARLSWYLTMADTAGYLTMQPIQPVDTWQCSLYSRLTMQPIQPVCKQTHYFFAMSCLISHTGATGNKTFNVCLFVETIFKSYLWSLFFLPPELVFPDLRVRGKKKHGTWHLKFHWKWVRQSARLVGACPPQQPSA